jgi:hypothetical protein
MVDFEGFSDGGKGEGDNVQVNTGKDGGAIMRDGVVDLGDGRMETRQPFQMSSATRPLQHL